MEIIGLKITRGAVLPYKKRILDILADHPGIQMTVGGHIHWPRLNTLNGIHHITLPSIIEGFFQALLVRCGQK